MKDEYKEFVELNKNKTLDEISEDLIIRTSRGRLVTGDHSFGQFLVYKNNLSELNFQDTLNVKIILGELSRASHSPIYELDTYQENLRLHLETF